MFDESTLATLADLDRAVATGAEHRRAIADLDRAIFDAAEERARLMVEVAQGVFLLDGGPLLHHRARAVLGGRNL